MNSVGNTAQQERSSQYTSVGIARKASGAGQNATLQVTALMPGRETTLPDARHSNDTDSHEAHNPLPEDYSQAAAFASSQSGIVIFAEIAFAALLLYMCNQPINIGSSEIAAGNEEKVETVGAPATSDKITVDQLSLAETAAIPVSEVIVADSAMIPNARPALGGNTN